MVINGKNLAYQINGKMFHCALDVTGHYIGGKWKSVVLWYLRKDKMRFSDLKRRIPDITEKMLSIQLRSLEEDGLVYREVFGDKPPIRVEYSLTEFGQTLVPVLEAIAAWGRNLGDTAGELKEV